MVRSGTVKTILRLLAVLLTAVLALVLIAACVVLWFYVGAYEATRPESVMAEFAQLANEEYWADAVEGAWYATLPSLFSGIF